MNYYILIIGIILVIIFIILFFGVTKKIIEKFAFLPQFTEKYDENIKGFQWLDSGTFSRSKIPTITITPDETKVSPNFIILYSHGNAENIKDTLNMLTKLSNHLGIKIFTYDYPGYGPSKDSLSETEVPSEKGCYENITKCYHHLCEKYKPENIIVCGRSIGSGCATYLAANYPVGFLILISPFRSVVSVVSRKLTFLGDIFPNEKNIKRVKAPIFILHGINDSVVPISHSEYLWSLIPYHQKMLFKITKNDHNDILDTTESLENFKEGFSTFNCI